MEEQAETIERYLLQNGLTCYLMKKTGSKSIMSVCLLVKAGTAYETQKEYGWFHFLEHLLIYPALYGCADERNEKGRFLAFEYALTSFAETEFWFHGMDETGKLLEDSILTTKGILEGRYLTEEGFFSTREDVLSEYQDFAMKKWFPRCSILLKNKGVCMPVGEREGILRANWGQLLERHQKYYRMENAALIISSSKELIEMRILVEKIFSDQILSSVNSKGGEMKSYADGWLGAKDCCSDLYLAWLPRKILPLSELLQNDMELAMVARAVECSCLELKGIERAECDVEIFSGEEYLLKLTVFGETAQPPHQEMNFSVKVFELAREEVVKQLTAQYDERNSEYRNKERMDSCRAHFLYGEPMTEMEGEYEICLTYLKGVAYEVIKEKFEFVVEQFRSE